MKRITRTPHTNAVLRQFLTVFVGMSVGALGSSGARAAHIHHKHTLTAREQALSDSWTGYVLAGPTVWARVPHPRLTAEIRLEMWHAVKTDPGASDAIVQFLLWKQSQDPARFARFHPVLSRALTRLSSLPTTAPQQLTPPPPSPSGGPPIVQPQQIPEPSALLVALGLVGFGIYRRRRVG
jgi:hypothetical protein